MKGKTKVSKLYNILIRVLIIAATYGFIYQKVFHEKDMGKMASIFISLLDSPGVIPVLAVIVLMMPLNWGIEAAKWRYLIGKIEKISFLRAYEAVFTGASISFFTPNRVGEYFGRVFILEKGGHLEGIAITIIGSISQLLITILTGTFALLLVKPAIVPEISGYPGLLYYSVTGIVLLLNFLLLLLYFNVSLLSGFGRRMIHSRFGKYIRVFRIFKRFRSSELLAVMAMSLSRYIVFSLQYFLLLKIFNVPVSFADGMLIISLVFLVITVLPTVALTELGIRDSAAVYLFGLYFSFHEIIPDEPMVGVLMASTFLWLLNLVVPAVMGTVFVYRLKFFRKTE